MDLRELAHIAYLKAGLGDLSEAYTSLDASRPWLCYWMLHGLEVLGHDIPDPFASAVVSFLYRCQVDALGSPHTRHVQPNLAKAAR